jgi:beta-lactamase regulating signal transducer with metallopeptidase domain
MGTLSLAHILILIVVTVAWLVLWILAIRSILRREPLSLTARVLWIVAAIIFPILGPAVWFAWSTDTRPRTPTAPSAR